MVEPEVSPKQACMLGRLPECFGHVRSQRTHIDCGEAPCPHPPDSRREASSSAPLPPEQPRVAIPLSQDAPSISSVAQKASRRESGPLPPEQPRVAIPLSQYALFISICSTERYSNLWHRPTHDPVQRHVSFSRDSPPNIQNIQEIFTILETSNKTF